MTTTTFDAAIESDLDREDDLRAELKRVDAALSAARGARYTELLEASCQLHDRIARMDAYIAALPRCPKCGLPISPNKKGCE